MAAEIGAMSYMTKSEGIALTAAQLEYQKLAREFSEKQIAPAALACEDNAEQRLLIIKQINSLGLTNVGIPEAFGGLDLSTLDACIIAEELAYGCCGISSASEASELAITPLLLFGSVQQKENFLRPLAQKPGFAGLALDHSTISGALHASVGECNAPLQAVPCADGFTLTGTMEMAVNAHISEWLFVKVPIYEGKPSGKQQADTHQWEAFILPTNLSGLKIIPRNTLLGRRACDLASIECDAVQISNELRLDTAGHLVNRADWELALSIRNFPIVAAGCVGVARRALELAISYAKQREAFGKPIGHHQGVAFMLADMAREVEAARLMTLKAAVACVGGYENSTFALSSKAYAQDIAVKTTIEAVQILGGYGYTKEYLVEKLMRDAKVYELFYGTSEPIKAFLGSAALGTLFADRQTEV